MEVKYTKDGEPYYEVPGIDENGKETVFKIMLNDEYKKEESK